MSFFCGVDAEVHAMQYDNPFVLPLDTSAEHEHDPRQNYPLEEFAEEAIKVLPSSDSILSTKTSNTTTSWSSTDTSSTLATSIASSLEKVVSFIWSGLNDIGELNDPSRTSWWRRHRSWPRPSEGSVDLEAGASLPLQPLCRYGTDAGCDFLKGSFGGEEGALGPKKTAPICITFDFEHKRHTYELEYTVFCQWKYVSLLINAIQNDGMSCVLIWDDLEELQVMAGDWEARARPGWQITIFCEDVDEDDCSELEDQEDEIWDDEKGYGEEWWFKRWKTRVEKKKEGRAKKRRSWLVGAVGVVAVAVGFCVVAWISVNEHRDIAIE